MTPSEELEIDAHILKASMLKTTSNGYRALQSLLMHGNLLSYAFGGDYSIFVNFTRVLNHIRLEFHFVPFALELKPDAKLIYRQNMMTYRPQEPIEQPRPYNKESSSHVGKNDHRDDDRGWVKTRTN
ncbi:hypothetical protein GJU43_14115 [Flavobacterium sp. LC2016-23]|uniref:hypothetical protein n=1 Tax=Flavobacterium sp. LC2016-23 TaxID=2666330 RepID=UPI0012B15F68|nr:hypothetical protein [Flavobacterium sp. LC2016-23]MRX40419.1 hypothetical protein [Flavobacterium sp. LC2016-23]